MSVWVLKRFDEQHFGNAECYFVSAGDRISPVEMEKRELSAKEIVHVDTGLGEFDHHTEAKGSDKSICAASLVRDHVIGVHPELKEDRALERMVNFAVEIDHFGEFFWPQPNSDRYIFGVVEILHHLKTIGKSDEEVLEFGFEMLDSIYNAFKSRISAEDELNSGVEFESKWGRGIGLVTSNDEVIKFAQREGYVVVVRKDPDFGNVRIKAIPGKKIDLTEIYEKIIARDPEATWFLHPAKTMLLNGSRKKPDQVPSKLGLDQVLEIIVSDGKR